MTSIHMLHFLIMRAFQSLDSLKQAAGAVIKIKLFKVCISIITMPRGNVLLPDNAYLQYSFLYQSIVSQYKIRFGIWIKQESLFFRVSSRSPSRVMEWNGMGRDVRLHHATLPHVRCRDVS